MISEVRLKVITSDFGFPNFRLVQKPPLVLGEFVRKLLEIYSSY